MTKQQQLHWYDGRGYTRQDPPRCCDTACQLLDIVSADGAEYSVQSLVWCCPVCEAEYATPTAWRAAGGNGHRG